MRARAADHFLYRQKSVALYLLLIASSQAPLVADEPTWFMAGIEMRLGMPREVLLSRLKEHYSLSEAGDDHWIIWDKEGPPFKMIGSVGFRASKLSWISRDWGTFGESGSIVLAKELFSLFSSLVSEGPTPALIHAKTVVRQPGLTVSQTEMVIGDTRVLITISETGDKGSSVTVQEILESPH